MISFDGFRLEDGIPIYLQIIMHIKKGAASGAITSGEELPSRRVLSTLLGVNPNTVQKAYKLLEDEGIISSHAGAGSVISVTEVQRTAIRTELIEAEIRKSVESLKLLGVDKQTALSIIEKSWEVK